jgi:hypothetical protein
MPSISAGENVEALRGVLDDTGVNAALEQLQATVTSGAHRPA